MSESGRIWLGHEVGGGRAFLDLGVRGCSVLALGSRSHETLALLAVAAKESGLRPIIFDMNGGISKGFSGYFDTFDYHSFLYDALKLEAPEHWHSQLAAAAYATALDLTSLEEAAMNSAMQSLAAEGGMASPPAVYDALGGACGFRAAFVEGVKGRIGSLKLFDAVDDLQASRLAEGNALVDFHGAPYPQAGELAACLLTAKLLAVFHSRGGEAPLFLADASRLFKWHPRPAHSGRLLAHLLELRSIGMSSDQSQAIDPRILEASAVQIYSSDAWHRRGDDAVLSGTLVLEDARSRLRKPFVPRRIDSKTCRLAPAKTASSASPRLTSMILEAVDSFPLSTRESLVQYLSPQFLQSDVDSEIAALLSQDLLATVLKDPGSGPMVFSYSLSDKGRKLLSELTG